MTSARVAAEGRRSAALRESQIAPRESIRSRLRLVDRTAPERRRIGLIAAVGGVVVVLFAIAAAQTLIISEQAHIDRVTTRIGEAETRAELLRVELAPLQPKATDDARAGEMPPAPTPTTVPKAKTSPSTVAKATTPTTAASTAAKR